MLRPGISFAPSLQGLDIPLFYRDAFLSFCSNACFRCTRDSLALQLEHFFLFYRAVSSILLRVSVFLECLIKSVGTLLRIVSCILPIKIVPSDKLFCFANSLQMCGALSLPVFQRLHKYPIHLITFISLRDTRNQLSDKRGRGVLVWNIESFHERKALQLPGSGSAFRNQNAKLWTLIQSGGYNLMPRYISASLMNSLSLPWNNFPFIIFHAF